MTSPLIDITVEGLFVDGFETSFPIPTSVLVDRWGRPDRWENEGNVILIWHDIGVCAYAAGDEHLKTLHLQLRPDQIGLPFAPRSTFDGALRIDGTAVTDRLLSMRVSGSVPDEGPILLHGVRLRVKYDGESVEAIQITNARVVSPVPPVPRDRYEIRRADGPALQFTDLNFKLAVIDALMYQQQVIEPKFSLEEFTRWFEGRPISLDQDAGRPIPEVIEYFTRLEIDRTTAERVNELVIDAGNEIYGQIAPHWDGEDDTFDIESWEDVALLPHLERITFISLTPDQAALRALRDRGIEVDV
jgi:hypothetical protein